jgi:hypothetical protein
VPVPHASGPTVPSDRQCRNDLSLHCVPLSNSTNSTKNQDRGKSLNCGPLRIIPKAGSLLLPGRHSEIGDYALHDQRAYHRIPFGRSANQSNIVLFSCCGSTALLRTGGRSAPITTRRFHEASSPGAPTWCGGARSRAYPYPSFAACGGIPKSG